MSVEVSNRVADIAHMLALRAEGLCRELLPAGKRYGAEWRCGSTLGEPGQSLGVHLFGDKAGVWRDFADDEGGDLIDLIQAVLSLKKGEAVQWAKAWLGLGDNGSQADSRNTSPPRHRRNDLDANTVPRVRAARALWQRGEPAAGTLVEVYLRARGITIPPPPTLRYVAGLKHGPTGMILPGMVAAIQGPDRRVCGVHRVFLRGDGRGKAPISQPKLTLGSMRGGAVRFGPAAPELGICEGIESGLSAMQLYALPVWCALGGGNMVNIALPDIVRDLTIFADNGEAGHVLAERAAQRFYNEGRQVRFSFPPEKYGDFNDLLRAQIGRAAA
jgi:hypothetical protein